MDAIFSKEHHRRTFFLLVAMVLVSALGVRFFVLPYYVPAQAITGAALFGMFLDNLVVSLLLAVLLGGFVFWLTPGIVTRSAIEVIAPKQINALLKNAAVSTRTWFYSGSCGRFIRATIIPKLAEAARTESLGRDITICILNPKNEPLCAAYATYRRSLKSANNGVPWSQHVVQEEILATAVAALRFQFSDPLLRIRLFFVDHFSAFRLDISDHYVVITKEDKEAAALRADAGTYFYDSYKDDVRLTERQSKEMICRGKLEFGASVDEAKLREALRCADIFEEGKLEELDVSHLLEQINSPSDPY